MGNKTLLTRLLYLARDIRSREVFRALREHAAGQVLDVGGWDFFLTARRQRVPFAGWTALDIDVRRLPGADDPRFQQVCGDGCALGFRDRVFDTVLCLQVLEHVFEPIRMVEELGRVLRPGGKAVLLLPQTSTTHLAPHYFGNFSRYWIAAAMRRAGLRVLEHRPLGGVWSSMASHLFFFFLQAARAEGMSDRALRRGPLFWVLLPLMGLWALVSLPVCLFFSLGDLAEEPNNHLVVVQRPPE